MSIPEKFDANPRMLFLKSITSLKMTNFKIK